MSKPGINEFVDINKFPPHKGLIVFGLSMSKLDRGGQTAKDCLDFIKHFSPSKISKPLVGLNFVYGDFLYLYSDKPAPELKKSFMVQVINHKNSMEKILDKNSIDFQIQHAFNYMVWNQLYVGTKDFDKKFREIKKIYEKDEKWQKYLKEDAAKYNREMGENQVNFFLEEYLMFYLITHNQVKLPNDYIEGQQKWILNCYPGKPLKGEIYLYQLNPFKLEWNENPYQKAQYDLSAKKLIEYDRVDLETY